MSRPRSEPAEALDRVVSGETSFELGRNGELLATIEAVDSDRCDGLACSRDVELLEVTRARDGFSRVVCKEHALSGLWRLLAGGGCL